MERKRITKEEKEPAVTPAAEQGQEWHRKYRPRVLKEVLGQDAVTKSLQSMLKERSPGHTYVFVGPSGTGKTTLARIMAAEFNCDPNNIKEVDAGSEGGADAMRAIAATFNYLGFGDNPNRALIIDECHLLTKQAWGALLKPLEEPPAHVFVFLCTTEAGKLPAAINTRSHTYQLKSLRFDDMMDLLEMVDKEEDLRMPGKILDLVARAADGSPRMALVMLSMVRDCENVDEAADLLESPLENAEVIELCRSLVAGKLDWPMLVDLLKRIPDMNPESVRIQIVNYIAACLMGAKSDQQAGRLLDMLSQFSKPFLASDKNAPLLLAFGNIIVR